MSSGDCHLVAKLLDTSHRTQLCVRCKLRRCGHLAVKRRSVAGRLPSAEGRRRCASADTSAREQKPGLDDNCVIYITTDLGLS